MTRSLPLAVAFAALFVMAGCDKNGDARTGIAAPPLAVQESPRTTVEPTPPPPPPNAPDKGGPPLPAPGQANDHSSPAFKAGGQRDPEKRN
jgi:hypothetical protein